MPSSFGVEDGLVAASGRQGWTLEANLAADLDAWTRLLGLHDIDDLADADPDTLRYRLWHLPAKLTSHARRRWLKISRDWPWAEAFLTCWEPPDRAPTRTGPTAGTHPDHRERTIASPARGTGRSRSDMRRPTPTPTTEGRTGIDQTSNPPRMPPEESRSSRTFEDS